MNNNDYYQEAMDMGDYIKAARLAIEFGKGKGSRAGAWAWAQEAQSAAQKAGITLEMGNLSWPDFEKMRASLEKTAR